jgi:predicted oxidoreductase
MERISLNKEVSLSRIVYGMWRLGDDENTSPEPRARQNRCQFGSGHHVI